MDLCRGPAFESAILSGIRNGQTEWSEHLAGLEVGRPNVFDEDQPTDPIGNAAKLEVEGRSTQDPYLLRGAWIAYRNAGRNQEAELCLAEAKFIDGHCLEAGELFLKHRKTDEALKAFWAVPEKGWVKIVEASQQVSEINARLECIFAQNLVVPTRPDAVVDCLGRLVNALERGSEGEKNHSFVGGPPRSTVWSNGLTRRRSMATSRDSSSRW